MLWRIYLKRETMGRMGWPIEYSIFWNGWINTLNQSYYDQSITIRWMAHMGVQLGLYWLCNIHYKIWRVLLAWRSQHRVKYITPWIFIQNWYKSHRWTRLNHGYQHKYFVSASYVIWIRNPSFYRHRHLITDIIQIWIKIIDWLNLWPMEL